jgi:hypothetical protein
MVRPSWASEEGLLCAKTNPRISRVRNVGPVTDWSARRSCRRTGRRQRCGLAQIPGQLPLSRMEQPLNRAADDIRISLALPALQKTPDVFCLSCKFPSSTSLKSSKVTAPAGKP